MNGTALTKTDLAAWRSLLARPESSRLFAASGICFASLLALPFLANETIALLFVFACAIFYYMQTRTASSLILPAIPTVILFTASGTMMLPAAFFAIVFGGACGAMLILSAKTLREHALLIIFPLAAYAIAAISGPSPLSALLSLLPVPAAVVAALAVRRCTAFTPAVAALTITISTTLFIAAIIPLALNGLLHVSLLPGFVEAIGDELIATLEQAGDLYAEAGVTLEISETAIRNLLAQLFNLSPAIFALTAMAIAYFTWRTLSILLVSFRVLPRLPRFLVAPTMSLVAACLFLLAYLVALIANAKTATPVGAVAQNLALILEPGLALVGVGNLLRLDTPRSCLSLLALIFLVYLVWSNPASALALAAFLGAIHVFLQAFPSQKQ